MLQPTVCYSVTGGNQHNVLTTVSMLSVSAAKYKRGFSATSHILTDGRNRMHISMLNSLLLISLNGPGVASFVAGDFQRCGWKRGSMPWMISWNESSKRSQKCIMKVFFLRLTSRHIVQSVYFYIDMLPDEIVWLICKFRNKEFVWPCKLFHSLAC